MADETDQDQLAAEWAAALEEQVETEGGGKAEPGGEKQDDALAEEWAAALAAEEETTLKKEREQAKSAKKSGTPQFRDMTAEAKAPKAESTRRDLDFILDIPLDVSAELGRTRLLINELLQLGQG